MIEGAVNLPFNLELGSSPWHYAASLYLGFPVLAPLLLFLWSLTRLGRCVFSAEIFGINLSAVIIGISIFPYLIPGSALTLTLFRSISRWNVVMIALIPGISLTLTAMAINNGIQLRKSGDKGVNFRLALLLMLMYFGAWTFYLFNRLTELPR